MHELLSVYSSSSGAPPMPLPRRAARGGTWNSTGAHRAPAWGSGSFHVGNHESKSSDIVARTCMSEPPATCSQPLETALRVCARRAQPSLYVRPYVGHYDPYHT